MKAIKLEWLVAWAQSSFQKETAERVVHDLLEAPALLLPEDRILSVRSAIVGFDSAETYPDCTVQILKNSETGESSVGWWPNDRPPLGIDGSL